MSTSYNPKIVTDGLVLMLDSANSKSWSQNAFEGARDLTSWYVAKRGNNTGNGCTVAQDLTTSRSPANGIPLKMTTSGNDSHLGSYNAAKWNIAPAVSGQTWILSVWAKASEVTNGTLYIFGANSSGVASDGAGGWYGISSKSITITTQWQRFDHYITFNDANVAYIQFRLDGTETYVSPVNIWWDGMQIEKAESSTALTDFNPKWNQDYANWYDLSGNGNHGVVSGLSIVYNKDEKTIKFPGETGNYITVDTPDLRTSNHTVIGISRFETSAGNGRVIAGKNNWLLGHYTNDYNQYYAAGWVNNPANNTGGEIWRMYAGIGNYTQDYWALYTNGQFIDGNSGGSSGPNGFSLGRYATSDVQYTPCRISMLMAYDRVLSATEIKSVYNALRGRYGI